MRLLTNKLSRLRLEWIYAVSMTLIGIFLVFLMPPFVTPDDQSHFTRAYEIYKGHLRSPSKEFPYNDQTKIFFYGYLPDSFFAINYTTPYSFDQTKNFFSIPFVEGDGAESFIANTGSYSPVVYAPQALFIALGAKLNSIGAVYYGARLGGLFFTIICVFFAIKLLPQKKLLIVVIAFMPMTLWEVCSCSADAVVYSISFLGIAFLLSLKMKSSPISTKELFGILLLAVALGLAKEVYGVILLLFLLIPIERFGGKKKFFVFGLVMLFFYFVAALGWIHYAKAGADVQPFILSGPEFDMEKQINFIKNSPLSFLALVSENVFNLLLHVKKDFIGKLGWLQFYLPKWFYAFYVGLILLGGILGDLKLRLRGRMLLLLGWLPMMYVTLSYLYVTWTPVGSDNIWGFQGRYLIPLAIMFFASLSKFQNRSWENFLAIIVALVSSAVVVFVTVTNYYL